MALSNTLAKAGFTAEQLDVTAEVTADKLEAGWTVIAAHLTVRGRVPGATRPLSRRRGDGQGRLSDLARAQGQRRVERRGDARAS